MRDFDEEQGIQTSALVQLINERDQQRWVFLGPDGAGLKVQHEGTEILVITTRAHWAAPCFSVTPAMKSKWEPAAHASVMKSSTSVDACALQSSSRAHR